MESNAVNWAKKQSDICTGRRWNESKNRLEYLYEGRVFGWLSAYYIEQYGFDAVESSENMMRKRGHKF